MTGQPTPEDLTGAVEVAAGVFVFTSGAYAMTSTLVLGDAPAGAAADRPLRPALLVDPGYFPGDLDRIDAFLAARSAEPVRIVLTHSDWDHVAGAGRWPDAGLVVSSEFPLRTAAEGERIASSLAQFDAKLYVERSLPFAFPEPASLVGSPSDLLWSGPRTHLLPAGGHTRDGLMMLLAGSRLLAAGDHLSDREIPFVGDSVRAYRDTLARVRSLLQQGDLETLVPGHGAVCGREEILARLDEDADYLARLEAWVKETRRSVDTIEGLLERCDEVVFRKGWGNPDVHAEHRANVALVARGLGSS